MASIRVTIITLPSNGGTPITALEVEVDGGAAIPLSDVTVGFYDVTGLPAGALSTRIRARNINGPGPWSASKTPAAIGAPGTFNNNMWQINDITDLSTALWDPLVAMAPQVKYALLQEDVATGLAPTWTGRGRDGWVFSNVTAAQQPEKLISNGGVQFASGAIKNLQGPSDVLAYLDNRAWLVIARSNGASGFGAVLLTCGMSGGNSFRQPAVFFDNSIFWQSTYGGQGDASIGPTVSTSYNDWHVMVGFRRAGMIHCIVDGVTQTPVPCEAWRSQNNGVLTFLGGTAAMGKDVAIDSIFMLDGELTDYQADLLMGYGCHRRGVTLPSDHPYFAAAPINSDYPDAQKPVHYNHDATEFATYAAANRAGSPQYRFAHVGENTFDATGYSRIFWTDFDQSDQAPTHGCVHAGTRHAWYMPTWQTQLGEFTGANQTAKTQSAAGGTGDPWTELYTMDLGATAGGPGRPGVVNMKMMWDATYNMFKASAISTVNNSGYGRTFREGIYKTRFRFHNGSGVGWAGTNVPGLFPGPRWGYGREHLFWRSRNRREFDCLELTGASPGTWMENNLHVHAPSRPYAGEAGVVQAGAHHEIEGRLIDPVNGYPVAVNPFDAAWHEHISKVEPDGKETVWIDGFEIARATALSTMLGRRYFIINQALDHPNHGPLALGTSDEVWLDIDYFDVLLKDTIIAEVPTGFSGRPTMAHNGTAYVVTPNTVGSYLEYWWYLNGIPIPTAAAASLTVAAGAGYRCMVRNVGLVNQPEAWTTIT